MVSARPPPFEMRFGPRPAHWCSGRAPRRLRVNGWFIGALGPLSSPEPGGKGQGPCSTGHTRIRRDTRRPISVRHGWSSAGWNRKRTSSPSTCRTTTRATCARIARRRSRRGWTGTSTCFVSSGPRARPAPVPAQASLHLRGEALNPPKDRRVVYRDTAFGHHRFQVTVADRVPAVPAHHPEHDSARRFGLAQRGRIERGRFADLVIFDPDRVIDTATYDDPRQFPIGIPYVLVNGQIAVDRERCTGVLAGQAVP